MCVCVCIILDLNNFVIYRGDIPEDMAAASGGGSSQETGTPSVLKKYPTMDIDDRNDSMYLRPPQGKDLVTMRDQRQQQQLKPASMHNLESKDSQHSDTIIRREKSRSVPVKIEDTEDEKEKSGDKDKVEFDPESGIQDDDENLPFPGFVPVAFRCCPQTMAPRRWCLRLVSWPYPFLIVLYFKLCKHCSESNYKICL